MPTFSSFEAFNREVDKLARDLEKEARGKIAMDMAKAGQKVARRAAASDLGGDPKFSGWAPRLATVVKRTRTGALLHPTRTSAGPWTVAEFGRHREGGVGGFQGPGVSFKTGKTSFTKAGNLRKTRGRKAKRWNGYTIGKDTASDALKVMEHDLPKIAEKGARKVTMKHFDIG